MKNSKSKTGPGGRPPFHCPQIAQMSADFGEADPEVTSFMICIPSAESADALCS
jgi:hypothetical protein